MGLTRREFLTITAAGGVSALFDAELFAAALEQGAGRKMLVLGGSAFALGIASAHPKDVVLLERGIHLAPEFSQTGDWTDPGTPTSDAGAALLAALEAEGLVTDGRLELPPLSDFLQGYFADRGVRSFFNAELVSMDGSMACIYGGGAAGLSEFAVAGLVDTTTVGWKDRGLDDVDVRTFTALTGRGTFTVRLPADADWRVARLKLYDQLKENGRGEKILAETNALGCVYRSSGERIVRRFADGSTWVPSGQFPTFIRAFEEGLKWNLV